MSGRLSRAQRDVLRAQDAPFLAAPLAWEDARSVTAHIRHMVGLLRSTRSPSPCTDAMAHIGALFDRTIAQRVPPQAKAAIACKKGCSHCCIQPVAISALEAFAVARLLREQAEMTGRVRSAGEKIRQAPPDRRLADMTCPMLENQACGVYEGRPLSCRNFASFNLNACITRFVMMGPNNIQFPAQHIPAANGCRIILFAALGLAGARDPLRTFEMKAALAALLEMDEGAESRWLAGADVLKDLEPLPAHEPMFAVQIQQLMAAVRPTV